MSSAAPVLAGQPSSGPAGTEPDPLPPANRPGRLGRWPWRLLAALAIAWLTGVAVQWLASGRFWLWLLPDLLPPIAFLAVPLLVLLICLAPALRRRPTPDRRSRRMTAVAALAALLLGAPWSGVRPSAWWGTPPVLGPNDLHIFAWNTEYWDQDNDPAAFYRYLTAQHADVYLLQEYLNWDRRAGVNGERQVNDLDRLHRAFPGYQIAARGELITLSRYPIVASPRVGPDRALAVGADYPTVFTAAKVLRTDIDLGGRVVSCYNTHIPVQVDLSLSTRFFSFIHQRAAARHAQLDGLAADITANPNPVVLAGDFNTSPAMGDLGRLPGGLRDAARADPSIYPASWIAGRFPALWRLDWTFTGGGLTADRYRLVDSGGLSDHRAQDVSLRLGAV